MPRTLPRLTALRAFAALAVFGYHLQRWNVWGPHRPFAVGYTGVAFFFVLSGFVLAWSTRPGTRAAVFYRRRFARVYPSHLVMLLIAAAVPSVAVARSVKIGAVNALLLQAWFTRSDVTYGMNGVSWSLSCEAAFYAAFPVAFVLLHHSARRTRWAVALGYYAAAGAVVFAAPTAHMSFSNPAVHFGEFLLGMIAALEVAAGWRPRIRLIPSVLLVLAVSVLARRLPGVTPNVALTLPFVAVLVSAAVADIDGRRGWLASRPVIYAGEVSFAFYLVHELVLINLGMHGATGAAVALACASAAAVTLHHLVERPAQRLLAPKRRARVSEAACEPDRQFGVVAEPVG